MPAKSQPVNMKPTNPTHTHQTPGPLAPCHQVVDDAVLDIRRKFYKQLAGYRASLEVYEAQRPIEELRLRLLADAGGVTGSGVE